MKRTTWVVVIVGAAAVLALLLWPSGTRDIGPEEYYGPRVTNGEYASLLGKDCRATVTYGSANPVKREFIGTVLSEHAGVLILGAMGQHIVLHKADIHAVVVTTP